MSAPAPVSFTVRRPTPISRSESEASESDNPSFRASALPKRLVNTSAPGSPLARSSTSSPYPRGEDSSDSEDDEIQDELVTGFDQFGVQRLHQKKQKPNGPLVIPALKNRDWREFARKRRGTEQYIPESGKAKIGADGSVGGLGTKDTINSGPQLSGLQVKKPRIQGSETGNEPDPIIQTPAEAPVAPHVDETEDERARRLIIASVAGVGQDETTPIIPMLPGTPSETDAYKQDVQELPEPASLDDYTRVPIEQFGAALLRGMGWKEGTAASNRVGKDGKRKGIVEPYLPESRPALLGIGAKERTVEDDGSNKKKGPVRPERRYVPVVKREREPSTRDRSRSPRRKDYSSREDRYDDRKPRRRDDDYDSGKDRKKRDRDYDYSRSRDDYDSRDRKLRDYDSSRDRRRDYSSERRSSRRDN